MDCFAALAMTGIWLRDLAACFARGLHFRLPSENSEGAGKTGCLLHPRSRVRFALDKTAHEHTGQRETLRPSLRNGFTAYFVLFPENGSFASVATQEINPAQLNASTAAPEPHDFAVRSSHTRQSQLSRPPHLTARS